MRFTNHLFATLAVLGVGFLAACSDEAQSTPQLTETETQAALDDLLNEVVSLAPSPQRDASLAAVAALGGVPSPASFGAEEGRLPRGIYNYDPATGELFLVGSSDDLVVAWAYTDPSGSEAAATMSFDWDAAGPTVQAAVPGTAERQEMPVGLNFKMSASSRVVADINVAATYTDTPECGTTVEPARLNVEGKSSFLTLSNLGYEVTGSGITSQGALALNDQSLGFAWQIRSDGSVQRDACAPVGFTPRNGEASFVLSVKDRRYELSFDIESFDAATGSASFSDGALTLDNRAAFTFAGTFDDTNDNGVPGDNLTLTFKGQQTATLEQLLKGSDMLNLALRTFKR